MTSRREKIARELDGVSAFCFAMIFVRLLVVAMLPVVPTYRSVVVMIGLWLAFAIAAAVLRRQPSATDVLHRDMFGGK